jgi:hypothetical protein
MRRLAIAAVFLTACTLAAQENSSTTAPSKSDVRLSPIWGGNDNADAKKSAAAAKKAPPAPESSSSRMHRESATLDRRNAVILKLREIAGRTSDDALMLKADQLEQRAFDIYMQKTTGFAGGESKSGDGTREAKR